MHDSLSEARNRYFIAAEAQGGVCPCCDRWGKYNSYTLNSGMARSMIWLFQWHMKNGILIYCHLPTQADRTVLTSNSIGKLRHWGLVEREPSDDPAKPKSGSYRLTAHGIEFVYGRIDATRKIFIYNDRLVGRGEDQTNIRQALTDKFNYQELMGDYYSATVYGQGESHE